MVGREIACLHLIEAADKPVTANRQILIADEHIAAVSPIPAGTAAAPVLAMPALVNAHDHGRAVRTSSLGASGKPLETWIQYQAMIPAVDPHLAAIVALSRTALGGVGAVQMHLTKPQGLTALPAEAATIARAAKDIGIRVGFAISMRDRNPFVYGPSEPILASLPPEARAVFEAMALRLPPKPREFISLCDEVAAAAAGPLFDVQFGPNGVQWCTDALLEAIAEASSRTGRRIHMHLLETPYQRAWADAVHPDGIVQHMDRLGLLSPRLTLAHCVWARSDELEVIAARGVTIAVNTSSNLHLRSGIAPVARMVATGCRIALGLDGGALDDDDDALRELRLLHLLHVGKGFEVDVDRKHLLNAAFSNGRLSVTNKDEDGALRPGNAADLLLLNWAAIDTDRLRDDIDPLQLILVRATSRHIRELIVAGRTIVKDGKVAGVDAEAAQREFTERLRAGMRDKPEIAAALTSLEQSIARHYEPSPGCF